MCGSNQADDAGYFIGPAIIQKAPELERAFWQAGASSAICNSRALAALIIFNLDIESISAGRNECVTSTIEREIKILRN